MPTRLKHWIILVLVTVMSSAVVWIGVGIVKIYENFDGPYYAVVAKCGYDKDCIGNNFEFPLPLEYYPAHFPLFPLVMKVISLFGLLRAGILVNLAASAVGGVVVYEIWRRMKWGNPLLVSFIWLFVWPRMWAVRSVVSPETMFILLTLISLYFFEKKNYWITSGAGILAALTKPPGILLFIAYVLVFLRKPNFRMWPVILIPAALIGLFGVYYLQTGDFGAYFHSGDNIHLQLVPFRVFDSNQPWVGNWWLEDVLWIYLIGGIGVFRALKKNLTWGVYGAVFLTSIIFVSHRDLSRYSLPLVPIVLLGLSEIFERIEVKWVMAAMLVPLYLYTVNFLAHNLVPISNWSPFL